jgi:hypothetical protein
MWAGRLGLGALGEALSCLGRMGVRRDRDSMGGDRDRDRDSRDRDRDRDRDSRVRRDSRDSRESRNRWDSRDSKGEKYSSQVPQFQGSQVGQKGQNEAGGVAADVLAEALRYVSQ